MALVNGRGPPLKQQLGGGNCCMITEIRHEVGDFAIAMELKLRKNDHKTGWRDLPIEALHRLMMLEVEEFKVALDFFGKDEVADELVDIANFAMMLRDRILNGKPNEPPVSA